MEVFDNPSPCTWDALCQRPSADDPVVTERVKAILARVKENGDRALRELSLEIEGKPLEAIEVSSDVIDKAEEKVSPEVKEAIRKAEANIRAFHQAQQPREIRVETAPGVTCIQRPVPIGRVGLYIPGGSAPLFSTVLMLAVPARLAGCKEVVLCTPAGKDGSISPEVLYTARFCGVQRIFQLGGAQAIAAMAYGTESVPRVDKIFGPGNPYVTTAKQLLSAGTVAIDMPAGPSEVMVLADSTTPAAFAAADLLSQAEHGPDSQVMLVCDSEATCQGILAVECRARDTKVRELLERITDPLAARRFAVERFLFCGMRAGCSAAVGAYAEICGDRLSVYGCFEGEYARAQGAFADYRSLCDEIRNRIWR